jgi:hypothetical protein
VAVATAIAAPVAPYLLALPRRFRKAEACSKVNRNEPWFSFKNYRLVLTQPHGLLHRLTSLQGNCWRQLPLEEKRCWEQRAKEEKQQHKVRHPDYRFRPVQNRNKNKDPLRDVSHFSGPKNEKQQQKPEEEMCCDAVAALLLEGKKGDELAQAVRNLDMARSARFGSIPREGTLSARGSLGGMTPPPPFFNFPGQVALNHACGLGLRRPSSVPLPDAWLGGFGSTMFSSQAQYPMSTMNLSHMPLMTSPRPVSPSPVAGISFAAQQQQTHGLFLRRPSSAQPMGMTGRSWTTPLYEGFTVMAFLHDLGIEQQRMLINTKQRPKLLANPIILSSVALLSTILRLQICHPSPLLRMDQTRVTLAHTIYP